MSPANSRPAPMIEPDDEDPRAQIKAGLLHAAELQRAADESQTRAYRLRNMRVANGFDVLLAKALEGLR